MRVTCTCCHRVETWHPSEREVVVEGGLRVPHPNATIAAYYAIKAVQTQPGRRVVAACPSCEQPMVTDNPAAAPMDWPLTLPDGSSFNLQTLHLVAEDDPALAALDEQIQSWERALTRSQTSFSSRIFQGSLLGVMLFPVFCWLLAVGMVILYLNHFFTVK